MNLVCDEKARIEILDKFGLEYKVIKKIEVSGYGCIHHESGVFFLEKNENKTKNKLIVTEISSESMWKLNKLQNPVNLSLIPVDENMFGKNCSAYFKRCPNTDMSVCVPSEKVKMYINNDLQLPFSDIYLMIPGKMKKEKNSWEDIEKCHNGLFEYFAGKITQGICEEYNAEFAKSLKRKCIGEVQICIEKDITDQNEYIQPAVAGIVMHDTGICILEIMVLDCSIGGNKLLNYYCGDGIKIKYKGEKYYIDEFCELMNIRLFGRKRSIVFAYGDISKTEIINALANEEYPMGEIGGEFREKVETQNIAIYDTAEVYVSYETLIEKCREMKFELNERVNYHAIEIFYLELILFQDASIDKVYQDLSKEGVEQRGYSDIKAATEKYEILCFDMAQSVRFGDYDQFNFPTTRSSAIKIAKHFGIDLIYEKYNTNKELLETMISANKRRVQERQDSVKNYFLLVISAVVVAQPLGDMILAIYDNVKGGLLSYGLAVVTVITGYIIYIFTDKISKANYKKKTK